MKIREGFLLKEVAGSYVVIAVGGAQKIFNGMINLNEVGALIWRKLAAGESRGDILSALKAEYDADEKTLDKDLGEFIDKLKNAKILED